jgi:uncharacterized protein (DUF302 family)
MKQCLWLLMLAIVLAGCAAQHKRADQGASSIYEVAVAPGVSHEDVLLSLKSLSEGMNLVNPAHFPIGEHLKERGVQTEGPLEVHAYCNLGLGADIMLDHPEFVVFAPCRIGLYERQGQLYLGLSRPTHDLRHIQNPTPRARKAVQALEDTLIDIVNKAAKGEF